jgi:hypothetical protein
VTLRNGPRDMGLAAGRYSFYRGSSSFSIKIRAKQEKILRLKCTGTPRSGMIFAANSRTG